jgi:hypothetical protein
MRVFIEPSYLGGSVDQSVRQAFEVLREAGIASARPGGSIGDYAIVFVNPRDVAKSFAVLRKSGMRAMLAAISHSAVRRCPRPGRLYGQRGNAGQRTVNTRDCPACPG